MSYNLFCTHPPSTISFLATFGVYPSIRHWSFFSKAWIGSSHTPSFSSSHSCYARPFLARDHDGLFQKHLFHILRANHPHVHRLLLFRQQSVPLWHWTPRSRVSHLTAPAGPLTCFHLCVSMSVLQRSASSTLSAYILLRLPIHTNSAQKSVGIVDNSSSTSNHSPPEKR